MTTTDPPAPQQSETGERPATRPPPAAEPSSARPPGGRRRLPRTFESLRVPAFRWYLLASFGTFGAMNMQMLVNG